MRRKARRNILPFTQYTMPEFELNWHHELVTEYLDAFVNLDITRLIICMPPRHTKSELVSRRLPAFILGKNPDAPIIAASYGTDLARNMTRDVLRIMDEDPYRTLFPQTRLPLQKVRLSHHELMKRKRRYIRTNQLFEVVEYNGYYRGSGIGGSITGMGMLYGIIDDPIKNRADANSPNMRNNIWSWYTSTFRTRLAPGGGILITCTRWHEDDLVGRLLAQAESEPRADQWEVINLPAIGEWDEDNPHEAYDPREEGEALWEDRFDVETLNQTKISIGPYDWNSLYQGRPTPPQGGMFPREKFQLVDGAPRYATRIRYWDKGGGGEGSDYTVGLLMAKDRHGHYYIEDVVRGQWDDLARETIIKQTLTMDRLTYGHVVNWQEQEGGSAGKDAARATVRNVAGFTMYSEHPTGDKVVRAGPYAGQVLAENVFLVKGIWNKAYLDELAAFPFGLNDDQVDCSSGAFNKIVLIKPGGGGQPKSVSQQSM